MRPTPPVPAQPLTHVALIGVDAPGACPDPARCEHRSRHASGPWHCAFNHPRPAPAPDLEHERASAQGITRKSIANRRAARPQLERFTYNGEELTGDRQTEDESSA